MVTNKSLLLKNDDTTKHVIGIDPDDESQVIEVWVRDISFLDIQAAAQHMLLGRLLDFCLLQLDYQNQPQFDD